MFENPRRGWQARNFTTNAPKILDLKSSSEQIFSRKLLLGAPASLPPKLFIGIIFRRERIDDRKYVCGSQAASKWLCKRSELTAEHKLKKSHFYSESFKKRKYNLLHSLIKFKFHLQFWRWPCFDTNLLCFVMESILENTAAVSIRTAWFT